MRQQFGAILFLFCVKSSHFCRSTARLHTHTHMHFAQVLFILFAKTGHSALTTLCCTCIHMCVCVLLLPFVFLNLELFSELLHLSLLSSTQHTNFICFCWYLVNITASDMCACVHLHIYVCICMYMCMHLLSATSRSTLLRPSAAIRCRALSYISCPFFSKLLCAPDQILSFYNHTHTLPHHAKHVRVCLCIGVGKNHLKYIAQQLLHMNASVVVAAVARTAACHCVTLFYVCMCA